MKTKIIKGKLCVTTYNGWFVKVHRELYAPDVYHVQLEVGRISLLMVVLIGAYLLWLT